MCVCALRIVSRDKILHFIHSLIIIWWGGGGGGAGMELGCK